MLCVDFCCVIDTSCVLRDSAKRGDDFIIKFEQVNERDETI